MSGISDDLATILFGLDLAGLTTSRTTARITHAIVDWALASGWAPRTEARVLVGQELGFGPETGYVDVIIRRADDEPDLAIEIDSADKPWSLAKLRHAACAGMHAIWVRWGDEQWCSAYPDVDVIQLPIVRRPAARRNGGQLTVW